VRHHVAVMEVSCEYVEQVSADNRWKVFSSLGIGHGVKTPSP